MKASFKRYQEGSCSDAIALEALGESFGLTLKSGDVVALQGPLGAGKTTFTKGIARALGIGQMITSPTFSIVSIYEGEKNLVHIDAYRLSGAETLDLLDYCPSPFIIVAEWSQNLPEIWDMINYEVKIEITDDDIRHVEFLKISNHS